VITRPLLHKHRKVRLRDVQDHLSNSSPNNIHLDVKFGFLKFMALARSLSAINAESLTFDERRGVGNG
jgi:hypothetical protein